MKISNIGFLTNTGKPIAKEVLKALIGIAKDKGYVCTIDHCTAGIPVTDTLDDNLECDIDILVAIGGDGTILRAAQTASHKKVPILGINLGRIGFLSEIEADEFSYALDTIRDNNHYIERRIMFECNVKNNVYYCLNDFILYKPSLSGVAKINVLIDGQDAGLVACDGVIISTPTGSTGYSISAGGPVIADGLNAAIVTPICPHALSYRPIVARADAELVLTMQNEGFLSVDGQHVMGISANDVISITKASVYTDFIRFKKRNVYDLIRRKLT